MFLSSGKAKLWSNFALCAVLATGVLLSSAGTARAQNLNVVYVESNAGSAPNVNSVFGFSNDGNGNLTALPGSPYLTQGTGFFDPKGSSIDSENQVIIRPGHNQLFAVNAHSNTIAAFTINADGSLSMVGTPVTSAGQEPLSLAISPIMLAGGMDVLSVANKAADPNQVDGAPNFATFTLSSTGVLTQVSGGGVTLASGAGPSQVTTPGVLGHFMFGSQLGLTSTLYSYRVKKTGALQMNNSVTAPTSGGLLLGNVTHPTQHVLYVGSPNLAQVEVYAWDHLTGNLSFVRSVANHGVLVCWLVTNTAGTRLYTAENGTGTVTVYNISHSETPVQLQHFTLSGTAHPTNIQLDPTGKFLYVVDGQQLHVVNVSSTDGTLTETITPTPLPGLATGELPLGLAVTLR